MLFITQPMRQTQQRAFLIHTSYRMFIQKKEQIIFQRAFHPQRQLRF